MAKFTTFLRTLFLLFSVLTHESAVPVNAEYSLFNPVPEAQMKEIATDRPDRTESAISLDAGHFQHETDLVNLTFDHSENFFGGFFAAPNLKVGLTESTDVQLLAFPYNYESSRSSDGKRSKVSGFGDLLLRVKTNLFGNDGESYALAVMPYLKLPTAKSDLGNGSLEGGVIFPWIAPITDTFEIAGMSQFDAVRREDNGGFRPNFVNSVTVAFDITDNFYIYNELYSAVGPHTAPEHTFDVGLVFLLCKFTQLDIGMNTGLNRSAPDYNPFLGLSQKF